MATLLDGTLAVRLRLQESVTLSWEADSPFAVDLTGRRPRFRIKGTDQKNGNDRVVADDPGLCGVPVADSG